MMPSTLFLLQFGCLTFSLVMALTLILSKFHVARCYKRYERSRWMLASAMGLLCAHFLLQMLFDIRGRGEDVGAMVNILFYTPVTFLISYAVLNLECRRAMLRRHLRVGLAGYALILGICIASVMVRHSLHIGIALYAADALFLACMLYFIFIPTREIQKTYGVVEGNTGGDMRSYLLYVKTGFSLLCLSAVIVPFSIVSTAALYPTAPLIFGLLLAFVVNFVALGYQAPMLQTIQENYEEGGAEMAVAAKPTKREGLPAPRVAHIRQLLEGWVAASGFSETELSLSALSLSLGVSRRELSAYFEGSEGATFRVWLSNVRLSAAKRLMLEHPEYSNDAISAACGFASRAQLYNIFRDREGMTPKEYLQRQLQG